MKQLTFNLLPKDAASTSVVANIDDLVIAGWAGRDAAGIQAHIEELAAIGVTPPSKTPLFYRLSAELLTQSTSVKMLGTHSSGEVECVLIGSTVGRLVTIGSDHTDRQVEAYGVAVSKQVCAKPLGTDAWLYADVQPHWDKLIMQSWFVDADGVRRDYQSGSVDGLLSPDDLTQRFTSENGDKVPLSRSAMYGGTLAVHGSMAEMTTGSRFEIELFDPVLQRQLRHSYSVEALPIVA